MLIQCMKVDIHKTKNFKKNWVHSTNSVFVRIAFIKVDINNIQVKNLVCKTSKYNIAGLSKYITYIKKLSTKIVLTFDQCLGQDEFSL